MELGHTWFLMWVSGNVGRGLLWKHYSDRLLVCSSFKMSRYAFAFIIGSTKFTVLVGQQICTQDSILDIGGFASSESIHTGCRIYDSVEILFTSWEKSGRLIFEQHHPDSAVNRPWIVCTTLSSPKSEPCSCVRRQSGSLKAWIGNLIYE